MWVTNLAMVTMTVALIYLEGTGNLQAPLVAYAVAGIFLSVLIGCGVFLCASFKHKRGHHQDVSEAIYHTDES
jgi:hypothetical protein